MVSLQEAATVNLAVLVHIMFENKQKYVKRSEKIVKIHYGRINFKNSGS
jgi:hypothetical protein